MISFCTRGTCSSGSSRPRSPRATITPCATFRISSRLSTRRRPLDLRDDRHDPLAPGHVATRQPHVVCRLHEAERDEIDAEPQAELEIVDVLGRERRRRQRHAWRIDALVLAERRAVHHDGRRARRADRATTRSSIRPSSRRRRSPGFADRISSAKRVKTRPALPGASPCAMRSSSPGFRGIGVPPTSGPVRILGPLRSCMIATWRPDCRAASRIRRNDSAWVSCVPCEKFRRKTSTPAAISACDDLGTVAGRTDGGDDLRLTHRLN